MASDGMTGGRRFRFATLHLLALIGCVAILLAILRISSAIAITLLVSIIPALIITRWLRKPRWSRTKFVSYAAALSLLLFFLYALTLGPARRLTLAMGWNVNLEIPYSPVAWLHHKTVLKEPIELYLKLWVQSPQSTPKAFNSKAHFRKTISTPALLDIQPC